MLIKICGITSIDEVKILNLLKPDYIGFIFVESNRKVSKEKALELYKAISREIKIVGVFRNSTKEYIKEIVDYVPIDVIQLHGDEDLDFVNSIKKLVNLEIWKAVAVESEEDLKKAMVYPVKTLVLDGSNPGCGKVFSWNYLRKIEIGKKFFLAGGINEENVIEGIELLKPQGIDVSSGVEVINKDGERQKDKEKIERLIRKVRENYEGKI